MVSIQYLSMLHVRVELMNGPTHEVYKPTCHGIDIHVRSRVYVDRYINCFTPHCFLIFNFSGFDLVGFFSCRVQFKTCQCIHFDIN